MSKQLVFGTLSDSFVEALSDYAKKTVDIAQRRLIAREEIKDLQEKKDAIIADMNKAIEAGDSFNDAKSKFSTLEIDKQINAINESLKEECKPLNARKKELLKDMCIKDLYNAYVVGVAKKDYSAKGTVMIKKKTKEVEFTASESFNTLVGLWLQEFDCKNADSEGAVNRFNTRYFVPFIGTKVDKLAYEHTAYSYSQFADSFMISLTEALVKIKFLVSDGECGYIRASEAKNTEA